MNTSRQVKTVIRLGVLILVVLQLRACKHLGDLDRNVAMAEKGAPFRSNVEQVPARAQPNNMQQNRVFIALHASSLQGKL